MGQNEKFKITQKEGFVVIALAESATTDNFFNLERIFEEKLRIIFVNKVNDFDSFYWHFAYKGVNLVLHYNVYNEIEIYPENCIKAKSEENNIAIEFVNYLKSYL